MNVIHDKLHWTQYYKRHSTPTPPSLFAQFVAQKYVKSGHFIELGCGNGRDSVFFAHNDSLHVVAIDICEEEIKFLNQNYAKQNLSFLAKDFSQLEKMQTPVDYIYSRFTLHSVNEEKEDSTLQWCYNNLEKDGHLFIEVRGLHDNLYGQGTKVDGEQHAFITDHYRRFADFKVMQKKLEDLGFNIEYAKEDSGFAPYENIDPIVIRLVGKK